MSRHRPTATCLFLLLWLWGTTAYGGRPAPAAKPRARGPAYPPVELVAPALGERLRFRPYDDRGLPRRGARRELSQFLRCPHTGEQRLADPRLLPVLYRMARHFGRPVVIFSGYRPRRLSTRPRSRHLTASAIDFQIPGVRNGEVVRWLRHTFHPLGVGFYPDGQHVHLDVDRRRDAYWVQRGSDSLPLAERLRRGGGRG